MKSEGLTNRVLMRLYHELDKAKNRKKNRHITIKVDDIIYNEIRRIVHRNRDAWRYITYDNQD